MGRPEQTKTRHSSSSVHVHEDLPSRAVRIMRSSCSFCTLLQDTSEDAARCRPWSQHDNISLFRLTCQARGLLFSLTRYAKRSSSEKIEAFPSSATLHMLNRLHSAVHATDCQDACSFCCQPPGLGRGGSCNSCHLPMTSSRLDFTSVTFATNGDYVLSASGHGSCGRGGTRRHQSQ